MTSRAELLREDAAGRRAAQTEFEGTLVVEAGAGTGKTTTLVARILAWALDSGWRRAAETLDDEASKERIAAETLRGIVAITFTEAGAAEMATRVAAALARLTSGVGEALPGFDPELLDLSEPDLLAHRAQLLLAALDHLTVETIHAYCRRLLTAYPLEAGLHPDLEIDPDLRITEEIAHEVVDEAVRRAYARPRGRPLAELATMGVGPDILVETLVGLREAGLEASALEADPLRPDGIGALVRRLASAVDRFLAAGGSDLRKVTTGSKAVAIAHSLERTAERLAEAPRDIAGLAELVAELDRDWADQLDKLRNWSRGTMTKGEASVLAQHEPGLSAAAADLRSLLRHLTRLDPHKLDIARRALGPLLADCERRSAARGIATFADLLAGAHRLLDETPALRRREQRRIQQLLVDEFQDTDPLQCEIVRRLALEGPDEDRPGLFLVGDPKQSIFGWRDADLAAYDGFVRQALERGGRRYALSRNFRSDPPILDEVGAVVAPIMIEEPGMQPPFVELIPDHRGTRLDAPRWAPVEYWVSWGDGHGHSGPETRGDEIARLEADAIAGDVRALHDEAEVRWGDVALLFRATSRVDTYLEALRDADVPFIVTRDKHYYRRKEILDAAALVRAVVDPLDHVALVATLRSASVGLPDAALLPLWRRDFPRLASAVAGPSSPALAEILEIAETLADELPAGIPGLDRIAGWQHGFAGAMETLATLRAAFRNEPAPDFIARLRELTLIEVTEAARYQGKYRLANLDRFFRRLEQAMVDRGNDMLAILRTLRRSLTEAPDAQEAPPKDSGEDAVQVLTIHKAKGLEFDHVYIPQMHAQHRRDSDLGPYEVDRRWRGTEEPQYCLLGAPTPGWHAVTERARRVEALESVRLLYVALTRARRRVVLLGSWPSEPSPQSPEDARCPLDLVHSRLSPTASVAELHDRCRERDRSWLDDSGIRWRFLGLAVGDAPPPRRRSAPSWLPTPESMAAEAKALARLRGDAEERMRRPRQRAASSEASAKLAQAAERRATDEEGRPRRSRDVALVVGTGIHRLLEEWDPAADPLEELERGRRRLADRLAAWLPPSESPQAIAEAEALLGRFSAGDLWARWLAVAPHAVARELPILLPAPPGDEAVEVLVGSIDLVFQDPENGGWVVADYKTDRVEGDSAIAERAEIYSRQEQVYVEALRQALDLAEPPRAELWFLWPDHLWRSS